MISYVSQKRRNTVSDLHPKFEGFASANYGSFFTLLILQLVLQSLMLALRIKDGVLT